MKQVFKINKDGLYLEPVLIQDNEDIPEYCVEEMPTEGLYNAKFENGKWVEGKEITELEILEQARDKKMEELNKQCNYTILNKRFSAMVDGVEYFFSCDEDAQKNFDKLDSAFDKGRTDNSPWTAYDSEGNVVRVILTINNFEPVYMAHLSHIQNNIIKLRDILEPVVRSSSLEELDTIEW